MAKLKILFVSANSIPGASLKVEAEYKKVKNGLRGKRNCNVLHTPSATLEEVISDIEEYKPNVVHFSAHGSPSEEIILTDEAGTPKPVPTRALEKLFKLLKDGIHLVVMNSCFSERQARAIAKSIDCVVGVTLTLRDDIAVKFSPQFYEALARGKPVAYAYDRAMISVYGEGAGVHESPKLFCKNEAEKTFFVNGPVLQKPARKSNSKADADTESKSRSPQKTPVEQKVAGQPHTEMAFAEHGVTDPAAKVILTACVVSDEAEQLLLEMESWRSRLMRDPRIADPVKARIRRAGVATLFAEPIVRPNLLDWLSITTFFIYVFYGETTKVRDLGLDVQVRRLVIDPLINRLSKKGERITRVHGQRPDLQDMVTRAREYVSQQYGRTVLAPEIISRNNDPLVELAQVVAGITARHLSEDSENARAEFEFIRNRVRLAFDVITRDTHTRRKNPLH